MVEDSIPPEYRQTPADRQPSEYLQPPQPRRRTPFEFNIGRALLGVIAALLLGMALTLQIRAWGAVSGETHGHCGGSYTPCPKGVTPILMLSFLALFVVAPAVIVLVIGGMKNGTGGKVVAIVAAVAAAVGVLPGNAIYRAVHGPGVPRLHTAWQLPLNPNPELSGEGSWAVGGTIIRAQVDLLAAYDVGTGRPLWTYDVPDPQLLCGMSHSTSDGIGVIAYGPENGHCNVAVGIDLNTGKQLWQHNLVGEDTPSSPTADFVAVAGDVAVTASSTSDDTSGFQAFDLHTGAPRWQVTLPELCSPHGVGGGTGVTAIVRCVAADTSQITDSVESYDPASGTQNWNTPVPYRGSNANLTVLSYSPLIIDARETDTRGSDQLYSFDTGGRIPARIDITAAGANFSSGSFTANPNPPVAVGAGLIVFRTSPTRSHSDNLLAYDLTTGTQVWSQNLPRGNSFQALTVDGDRLVMLTEASFDEVLNSYDLRTGAGQRLGMSGIDLLTATSQLHVVNGAYVIIDADGNVYPPIVVLK